MDLFNSQHIQEFEFALLNPQFRELSALQIAAKVRELRHSPEAYNFVYTIESAIVDHGGIDSILEIKQWLSNVTITDIILSHEGSRTGAPVVCRNLASSMSVDGQPVIISFGENAIFSELDGIPLINFSNPASRTSYWGFLLGRWLLGLGCLADDIRIIGSTLESSEFLLGFCDAVNKGSCVLLHEHPYYYGHDKLERLFAAAQAVVYSSDYVLNGWKTALKSDADKYFHHWLWTKQPQPIQSVSRIGNGLEGENELKLIPSKENQITISGAGHIQPRKGVHLFLELVAEIARMAKKSSQFSNHKIIATWIGNPEHATEYSLYISSKANWIQRELENLEIYLLPSCDDYVSYIHDSDIFLSTSTVDPLPNVVLDALASGVPAFVIGGSNGHEEYYRAHGLGELVLPPNSIKSSAQACLNFFSSGLDHHNLTRSRIYNLIGSYPTQANYAGLVREEAKKANLIYQDVCHTALRLSREGWIDVIREYGSHFVSYQFPKRQLEYGSIIAALHAYWGYCSKVQSPLSAKFNYRRLVHALLSKESLKITRISHQIASVIDANKQAHKSNASYDIHIHAYYPDVALDIIKRIECLSHHPRKVLITYPQKVVRQVESIFSETTLSLVCVETPDIGRNILPIKHIANHIESDYIIHLHTKKSTHSDPTMTNRWNEYLISSLIGNERNPSRVAKIVDAMHERHCAVAYPLEPTYQQIGRNSTGMNRIINQLYSSSLIPVSANPLSNEMYFPYPCGCMFIAETSFCIDTLVPMINLVDNEEIAEPLAYDGTVLHAIERCIPLAASLTGKDVAFILPPAGLTR
jgi:glycosyltransferase involved in cell wall biosynthesis